VTKTAGSSSVSAGCAASPFRVLETPTLPSRLDSTFNPTALYTRLATTRPTWWPYAYGRLPCTESPGVTTASASRGIWRPPPSGVIRLGDVG
jgi:hypothetical protein